MLTFHGMISPLDMVSEEGNIDDAHVGDMNCEKEEVNAVVAPKTLNSLFNFNKEESMRRRDLPVAPIATSSAEGEDDELTEAAKTVRDHKKALLAREKKLIMTTLRDLKSLPLGKEVALKILEQMECKHAREEVNALKSFLKTLLENISRNPDNEKLRTLRANNAIVHEKVTRHAEGLSLLVAIGFKPEKDAEAEEAHFNQNVVVDGTWIELDVMNIIILKLVEPSPEIDMQAWMAWFDGLQEYAAIFA